MTIGQMTERTGIAARLLRYYEQQQLITPGRDVNGYRQYCALGVERIAQIRALLDAGLSTRMIRDLLPRLEGPDITHLSGPAGDVLQALCDEATALQARIDQLTARHKAIVAYAERVSRTTSG
ncbi:MerR family transcriptional regulator [Actinoplanes sp. URMC 104]|uniref:MerR family transcriptional regulator n=1 Tax=Actinoplanes sp. URMC 104 TaxID=3423409 RepID=UPI003F1DF9F6